MIVTENKQLDAAKEKAQGVVNKALETGKGFISTGKKAQRADQLRTMRKYAKKYNRAAEKKDDAGKQAAQEWYAKKAGAHGEKYYKVVAAGQNAAKAAGILAALALMGLAIKKILKKDPNSAVAKEAAKRVKELEKEIKQAQKEVKKAKTPAEAKAAEKKIKTAEKKVSKLKTQIGRLADKNLEPKEVEKIKKSLEKMIAESVASAYTEPELMFTSLQSFTESVMEDHYYVLALEAAEQDAEMDDIFGEDAEMDPEIADIFGEDADEDFEESFDDIEDGPEFDESVFEDFDLDW